jgi:hypothetical protein
MSTINWNSDIRFPADSCFLNRVTSAKVGPSKSSGKRMITLEMEVVSPDTYDVAGQLVNIAGVKTTNYYSIEGDDDEGTAKAQRRVFKSDNPEFPSLAEKFRLDWTDADRLNPPVKELVGKVVMTQMDSDEDPQRRTPTAAQIEKAKANKTKPEGDVMIHPVTKKPIYKYYPRVKEIFALAEGGNTEAASGNKPY